MKSFLFLLGLAFSSVAALYQLDGAPWSGGSRQDRAEAASGPSQADTGTIAPAALQSGAGLDPDAVQAIQADILSKPLFARSRKPGDDKVTAAPPAADSVFAGQQARLLGVYLAPPVRRALVRFADSTPEWLNEGDTSRGWTVRRVSSRDAVIAGANGEMTLDLHAPTN